VMDNMPIRGEYYDRLRQVREGMEIYDNQGGKIGKVSRVHLGEQGQAGTGAADLTSEPPGGQVTIPATGTVPTASDPGGTYGQCYGVNKEFVEWLNDQYYVWAKRKGRIASANEFAVWLDVSSTSLSQWMNGVREPVGKNIHKIADKLGLKVYDLLGEPRRMPDDPMLCEIVERWFQMTEAHRSELLNLAKKLIP
jgi:transcriptional regulator with XRE-family HTH domain